MSFLSGWNQSGGKSKLGQFVHNTFDRNNDGRVGGWEAIRTGLSFLNPMAAAGSIARGGYNMYRDANPSQGWQGQQPDWNRPMPVKGQYAVGDLAHELNIPQLGGLGNYTGGSATFNERTGTYATPPQNGFLTGFNPTAAQYRNIQLGQQRNDAINGWLNNPSAASPFGQMNPGDRALANHSGHVAKMEGMRWAGDMNPSLAQAEYNDQNAARFKAAMMYK